MQVLRRVEFVSQGKRGQVGLLQDDGAEADLRRVPEMRRSHDGVFRRAAVNSPNRGTRFDVIDFSRPRCGIITGVNAEDAYRAKLVNEMNALKRRNAELEERRHELLVMGVSSASISAGGGSRSQNYLDVQKYADEIARNTARIDAIKKRICGRAGVRIGHIAVRRA